MKNIGNNILDNLKQMRRPYVAPAMLVEEVVEEGEMLAGTLVDAEENGVGTGEGDDEDPAAKQNNYFFFGDDVEEWYDDEE